MKKLSRFVTLPFVVMILAGIVMIGGCSEDNASSPENTQDAEELSFVQGEEFEYNEDEADIPDESAYVRSYLTIYSGCPYGAQVSFYARGYTSLTFYYYNHRATRYSWAYLDGWYTFSNYNNLWNQGNFRYVKVYTPNGSGYIYGGGCF